MLGGIDSIGKVLDSSNVSRIETIVAAADEFSDRVRLDTLDIGFIQAGRTDTEGGRIQTA